MSDNFPRKLQHLHWAMSKILQICGIFEDKRQIAISLCENFLGIHGKFVKKQQISI